MTAFSTAFRALLTDSTNPPVVPVATVYWPAACGGTRCYSSGPFLYYEDRIPEGGFDNVTVAVSERPSDLASQTFRLSLDDKDGAVTTIIEGADTVRRSRVVAKLASEQLPEADWYTFFDGIVDDWQSESGVVVLGCRTDEVALNGFCPKVPLRAGNIPGLIEKSRGVYAPVIYGLHDDQSLGGKGAVKTIPVNATTTPAAYTQWIVGQGRYYVDRVFKNGAGVGAYPTYFGVSYPNWGGTWYTVIVVVANCVVDDEITADVRGLTSDGTEVGPVITNSAEQLQHFLVNFVWGDWRSGAWLSATHVRRGGTGNSPIDTDSFAEASSFLATFGGEGSLYVGGTTEQTRCMDVLNGWLKGQPMLRARWSRDGELGLRVINHLSGEYLSTPWVQAERDELSPLQYEAATSQLVSRVSLSYLPGQREGKLWQSLDLQDLRLWQTEKTIEQLALNYSAARFQ